MSSTDAPGASDKATPPEEAGRVTRAQSLVAAREDSNSRLGIQLSSKSRTADKKKNLASGETATTLPNRKEESAKLMIVAQASYAKSKLVTKNHFYSEAAAGLWYRPEDIHTKKHRAKETMRKSRTHIIPPNSTYSTYLTFTFNCTDPDYVAFFIETLVELISHSVN